MRITGGTARGRKLFSPGTKGNNAIRPSSDRMREALFSILGATVSGSHVLDLYAGTGSLGLDALSRGAASAVFVDRSPRALEIIRRNLSLCFPQVPATLLRLDLTGKSFPANLARNIPDAPRPDLVFLDPPYGKNLAETTLTLLEKSGLLASSAQVVVEERCTVTLPERFGRLSLHLSRRYGETRISMYKPEEDLD